MVVLSEKVSKIKPIIKDSLLNKDENKIDVMKIPFMFLSLDLPPAPLFKSDHRDAQIPQIQLTKLLQKYDGITTQELAGHRKRYKIEKLPHI